MSEVCGLLRLDGASADKAVVEAACASMRGRGAGPVGSWIDDERGVGLACAPLATTPEDRHDRQPLISADGAIVLVADARIDNREALARELGVAATEATPDSALILAAYRKWGDDAAVHLVGDFAIVVWDGTRRRLWCARDHIGQRTLAYRAGAGSFAVASAPSAVPRLDGGRSELDLDKVSEFLIRAEDPARTFWAEVKHLPPGHTLVADGRGVRLREYWRLEDIRSIRLRSDDEYVVAFSSLWREAVGCRLRSDGPIGVMLSGGLDSSAVAATAATELRARGERLLAWHAAPSDRFAGAVRTRWIAEETEDVRAMTAAHDNIDLDIVRPDGRTFLDDADALFRHACLPMPNADNRHWFEGIVRRAAERGARVMLGGYKGNATISYTGIRGLRRWAWTGRWRRLVREASALAQVRGRRTRAILREAAAPPLPHRLNAWVHTATRRARRPFMDVFPSAIHPELVRERRLEQRVRDMGLDPRVPDRSLGRDFRVRNMKRAGDAADLYRGLRALYGVELRDPTSDLRIVEFCLGIPDEQYLRGGRERMLVRRAMAGLVPDAVLHRHTRGAQSPDWYERLTPARPRMRELIDRLDASDTVRGCIDVPRLRRLVDAWPDAPRLEDQPDHQMRLATGLHTGAFLLWFEAQAGGSDA